MITRTSTTLFCNICTIVTSNRKYDHIGVCGINMWEGCRMQRSKFAIVLHCLFLAHYIYSICISLYNHKCTALHCYDSGTETCFLMWKYIVVLLLLEKHSSLLWYKKRRH